MKNMKDDKTNDDDMYRTSVKYIKLHNVLFLLNLAAFSEEIAIQNLQMP